MSIIVRDNGILKLFIKGADSVIKSLLNNKIDQPYKKYCEKKIDEYSKVGFRCLCIAMKVISDQDYQIFCASIENKTNEQICNFLRIFVIITSIY